jgi:hypothetical protein
MNLVSIAEHLEIRAALRDVSDTFFQSDVIYRKRKAAVLNRFMEDLHDGGDSHDVFFLKGFVEYSTLLTDESKNIETGWENDDSVTVSFHLDYLDELGLINPTTFQPIFETNSDEIIVGGKSYNVVHVVTDGQLQPKNILVVVYGNRQNRISQ